METMKDRLYLFQCYPQITTTLTFAEYTDDSRTATKEVKVTSDDKGAAAYYAAYGIASDVYCQAESEDDLYVGTFYKDQLKTGEGDSTQMELYPCNNLQLRRAAYAYLYLKKPDGTPTRAVSLSAAACMSMGNIKNPPGSLCRAQDKTSTNPETRIRRFHWARTASWRLSWTRPSGDWRATRFPQEMTSAMCSKSSRGAGLAIILCLSP